jgi:hypothetical protein
MRCARCASLKSGGLSQIFELKSLFGSLQLDLSLFPDRLPHTIRHEAVDVSMSIEACSRVA